MPTTKYPPMPSLAAKLVFRIRLELLVEKKKAKELSIRGKLETSDEVLTGVVELLESLGLCVASPASNLTSSNGASQNRCASWKQDHPDQEQEDYYNPQKGLWEVCRAHGAETAPQASWVNDAIMEYVGVSVRTPLFWPTSDWMAIISRICEALTANRTVGINTNTSLKVEIKPAGRDFELSSLKAIVRFLWAAGPLIDELHPPHCAPSSYNAPGLSFTVGFSPFKRINLGELHLNKAQVPYKFNRGKALSLTSPMFELPALPQGPHSSYYAYRLWKMDRMSTIEEFEQILRIVPVKGAAKELTGAFQFSALQADESDERCIVFSQHPGTLNVPRIFHWVSVCLSMVDFCLLAAPERMKKLLEELGDRTVSYTTTGQAVVRTEYTVQELLRHLDLNETAEYFESLGRNPQVPELTMVGLESAVDLEHIDKDAEDHPQYTFGVEMEFMVPAGDKSADPWPHDSRWFMDADDWSCTPATVGDFMEQTPRATDSNRDGRDDAVEIVIDEDNSQFLRKRVAKLFTDNGFFAITSDDWGEKALHGKATTGGFILHPGIEIIHQAWHIQHDISLHETTNPVDGYSQGYAAMEVASPVGRVSREGFKQFADGLSLMRNSFRIIISKEAGLHVHVSPHDGLFDLLQLKRITTIIWFAEPILQLLIAPHRRGPMCGYCLPISTSSEASSVSSMQSSDKVEDSMDEKAMMEEMLRHMPFHLIPSCDVQQSMEAIWNAVSLDSLITLTGHSGLRCAVTFTHIREVGTMTANHEPALKGTIEFRSAQGCMDQMYIIRWIRLCVALVHKGQHGESKEIRDMLFHLVMDEESPAANLPVLLEDLGLSQDLEFWHSQVDRFSVAKPDPLREHVSAVSQQEAQEFEELLASLQQ